MTSRKYIKTATKAAAHPTRFKILKLLKDSPQKTGDLLRHLEIKMEDRQNLYHHLNVLKEADLIYERKEKKANIYFLKEHKRPLAAVVIFDEEDIKTKRKEFEAMIDLLSAMEGKEIPFKRKIVRAEICLYFKESK